MIIWSFYWLIPIKIAHVNHWYLNCFIFIQMDNVSVKIESNRKKITHNFNFPPYFVSHLCKQDKLWETRYINVTNNKIKTNNLVDEQTNYRNKRKTITKKNQLKFNSNKISELCFICNYREYEKCDEIKCIFIKYCVLLFNSVIVYKCVYT